MMIRKRGESMSQINSFSFRQLAGHYVLLTNIPRERLHVYHSEFLHLEGDNALLTYGYIDHNAGLSFEVLCFAKVFENGKLELRPGNESISFKIRYDGMVGDVVILSYDISMAEYSKKVKMISEGYNHSDEVNEIRKFKEIDADRHPQYPDDVKALLFKDGVKTEIVWIRTNKIIDGKIAGILLNQPNSPMFGLNRGDIVTLVLISVDGRKVAVVETPDIYL